MNTLQASRMLRRVGLYGPVHRLLTRISGRSGAADAAALAQHVEGLSAVLRGLPEAAARAHRRVLIAGWSSFGAAAQQASLVAGFIRAGYAPVVILASRADRSAQTLFRLAGVRDFLFWTDLRPGGRDARHFAPIKSQADLLAVEEDGLRVGRYAVSTMMRNLRTGRLDLSRPEMRKASLDWLQRALDAASFARQLLSASRADAILVDDRGYVPLGPLFERAISDGIPAFTWNAGHRDGTLILKRYGLHNRDQHPTSLSPESWSDTLERPFTDADWQSLYRELEGCYASGQWYSEVGTQFNKTMIPQQKLRDRLGLRPDRPTVLVFPHIFWDGTFFWGEDVFADYQAFFEETMRVARQCPEIDWVVKVHPANVVKNRRDGVNARPGEWDILGSPETLPRHIRVLDADSDISTWSLFQIGDMCVTVRGTVGIEAACLGLTTVTAGTGRYDGLGFTQDVKNPEDFRELLRNAATVPKPEAEAVERARRFAARIFFDRTLPLNRISFAFAQDALASTQITVDADAEPLIDAPEAKTIAAFILSEKDDLLLSEHAPSGVSAFSDTPRFETREGVSP